MTDDQIQKLIRAFLISRDAPTGGAQERELFGLVKQAVAAERERCARVGGMIKNHASALRAVGQLYTAAELESVAAFVVAHINAE